MGIARGGGAPAALIAALALALAAPGPLAAPVAPAAECSGDECQSVPPAPDDPVPGTASAEGPENPPARFGGRKHHRHRHHKHHRHHRGQG